MSIHIKRTNWNKALEIYTKNNSQYREIGEGWVKKNGVWSRFFGGPPSPTQIEYARFIPGRIDSNLLTISDDLLTVEKYSTSNEASAMADVMCNNGKRWFEFKTYSDSFSAGNIYVGMILDWFLVPTTAGNIATSISLRVMSTYINILSGSTLIGQTESNSFYPGDVVGFGYDFSNGNIIVHVNGVEKGSFTANFSYQTSYGDIGNRRIFVGFGPAAIAKISLFSDRQIGEYGPPDESWQGWTSPWTNVQQVTTPSTWLKGGEVPVSMWAKANDNGEFDSMRTFEFLLRCSTTAWETSTLKYIFSKSYTDGAGHYFSTMGSQTNVVEAKITGNATPINRLRTMKPYDGFWHRWTVVGSWATGKSKLYCDGVLMAEAALGGTGPANNIRLLYLLSVTGNENYYNIGDAEISDVRIWNTERTQEEITSSINYKSVTGSETGLVGLWFCDEGSGVAINDQTSYAHQLTASNAAIWQS